MKKIYFLLFAFLMALPTFGQDLVISGVYDAGLTGGTPKGVELYVIADIADLSLYGIGSANNGGGSDGQEFTFPAVAVTAGTFIYVASEATQFTNFFGFAPDYTSGSMAINGDDALELYGSSAVIDTFGDINTDGSGEPWEYLDGWAYRVNNTGPDGATFVIGSWNFSGINVLDNETSNATAATPVPVGTYMNNTLSTQDLSTVNFSIYPNPTSNGFVNITTTSNEAINVKVFDVLGKQVLSQTINNRLNVSNLNTGVYILQLNQNGATTTKKLVIK